jgi:RNA polymerase sigma-70 factor (ECF subfamily)
LKEAEIIYYCKQGNHEAFKALVDKYASKLMGICLRYMQNEFEAKDVLQESFIRIFKSISVYESSGSFEGWLNKIVVRSSLMALRKKKNGFAYLESIDSNEDWSYKPEIEIELNEEDILKMIHKLPEHYRVIFNMSIIEGYSHAEIAELLQIKESTSRTKLTRARKKMKEIYFEEFQSIQLMSSKNMSDR